MCVCVGEICLFVLFKTHRIVIWRTDCYLLIEWSSSMSGYSIKNGGVLLESEDNSHQDKRERWLVRTMSLRAFIILKWFFFSLYVVLLLMHVVQTHAHFIGANGALQPVKGWSWSTMISSLRIRSLKFDLRCGAYPQIWYLWNFCVIWEICGKQMPFALMLSGFISQVFEDIKPWHMRSPSNRPVTASV